MWLSHVADEPDGAAPSSAQPCSINLRAEIALRYTALDGLSGDAVSSNAAQADLTSVNVT